MLGYGVEIARALAAAHHEGIVHRDLKPGNVMITATGVKLLDFGLANAVAPLALGHQAAELLPTRTAAALLTIAGAMMGTAPYMAPEQINGHSADARTDVFAWGAVPYEMATGERAFAGDSTSATTASVRLPHWIGSSASAWRETRRSAGTARMTSRCSSPLLPRIRCVLSRRAAPRRARVRREHPAANP